MIKCRDGDGCRVQGASRNNSHFSRVWNWRSRGVTRDSCAFWVERGPNQKRRQGVRWDGVPCRGVGALPFWGTGSVRLVAGTARCVAQWQGAITSECGGVEAAMGTMAPWATLSLVTCNKQHPAPGPSGRPHPALVSPTPR